MTRFPKHDYYRLYATFAGVQHGERVVRPASAEHPEEWKWWVGNFQPAAGPFHVFLGGDPQRIGELVVPVSLQVLSRATQGYQLTADAPEQERRRLFAEWITAVDNPLTPRVLANRVWHYLFGTGLVDTPSDFGFMGGRPTHPDLLDWLALELIDMEWRLKPLQRRILFSQTYRQASCWRPDAAEVDAEARLLWRFPPRRLSSEQLRDSMLLAAGQLDETMGGPGFRLFRYFEENVATYYPLDEHGPETYRRAVYHHQARATRVDLMSEFDTPDCAFATPRRSSTTTPLQALTLLNHRFTIDMAEHFAQRLVREAGEDGVGRDGARRQVEQAFLIMYARRPDETETCAAVRLIEQHGLTSFCRALFNSNEFIYVN